MRNPNRKGEYTLANESDRKKTVDEIVALNAQLQDLMKTQSRSLGSVDMDRAAELVQIQNRFNAAIRRGTPG